MRLARRPLGACMPWPEVAAEVSRRTGRPLTAKVAQAAAAEACRRIRDRLAQDPYIRERVADLGGRLPKDGGGDA